MGSRWVLHLRLLMINFRRMKGTITEVQDRSISFLDKLKEANLPKPLKSSASSVKGGGDVSDEDNMDE